MSRNSGSKAKRSYNSISSNSDGKNSNKKKSAQKTLGASWGANSTSSSRSSFGKAPFSDFGSYMAVKNQKLHEQFDAAASSSSHSGSISGNSIFSGVSIFVDGYTVPSSQELRGYMLKYGGHFENYFSRHRVTHIICSNLPNSKIKNLRAFSGGLPVVEPTWVIDSISANKLLSWVPYELDQIATGNGNQSKLSAFFALQNRRVSHTECSLLDDQVKTEKENPPFDEVVSCLPVEHKPLEQLNQCNVEVDELSKRNMDKLIAEETASSVESHCDIRGFDLNCTADGRNTDLRRKSTTYQDSNDALSSGTKFSPNHHHSTLTDPNFVDNYFRSSRLHFIGTWRNRYRNRIRNSSGFAFTNSIHSTATAPEKTVVIHIDLDSFFVSVVIRDNPELQSKPVAVCHSDNPCGTAEISSANYPARDHGVKAGMFVKDAKVRCPQLVIVPYNFGAYEKVADHFYDILHKHCNKVQAVSCDEAFLDVSESEVEDPQHLAAVIRQEIFNTTGCTASAGISSNMLMARLATKTAKPDGQHYLPPEKIDEYLLALPVKSLPGIGHVLEKKLKKVQIETCGQLRLVTKESLQKDFGYKTGEMLWNYSRGIDNRSVGTIQENKSIGAEVNWGVRFTNPDDTRHFLTNLCKEVALRLQGCGVHGRSFTLKIKKRKIDSGEPLKYMGCGDCENLSHSMTIPVATDDVDVLQRLATKLFGHFRIDVEDIRGMGFQVSKLESADTNNVPVQKRKSVLSWLASSSSTKASNRGVAGVNLSNSEISVPETIILPPLHDLDITVIESLPPEVVSEINDMYAGKLFGFISENTNKKIIFDTSLKSEGTKFDEEESLPTHLVKSIDSEVKDLKGKRIIQENVFEAVVEDERKQSGDEAAPILAFPSTVIANSLMPASLSQVDRSTLHQLPEELRKDILELLPLHRVPEFVEGSSSGATKNTEHFDPDNLWVGNPPQWVHKFKGSSFSMLNLVAKMYQSEPCSYLSSLLQRLLSDTTLPMEGQNEPDDAVSCMYNLFKQYIDFKIQTDMEEIHFCMCLLRRLKKRSNIFIQIYDGILPYLQASMSEKYGGTLNTLSMS